MVCVRVRVRIRNVSKFRIGATYDVHLGLIGKRVVDFLLVLIELFSLGRTADALRAEIAEIDQLFRSNAVTLTKYFR